MPNCMRCHKPVVTAKVLCGECEAGDAKTIAALQSAICGTCYRNGRVESDHACMTCEPMRLLRELTNK